MDPARKRRIRLVVALSAAVVLAAGLVVTSFSAASDELQPSGLRTAATGETYRLTGKVVPGSIRDVPGGKVFRLRDHQGPAQITVRYPGAVPDTFRDNRQIILEGRRRGGEFVGDRDTLSTKCPSKFVEKQPT